MSGIPQAEDARRFWDTARGETQMIAIDNIKESYQKKNTT